MTLTTSTSDGTSSSTSTRVPWLTLVALLIVQPAPGEKPTKEEVLKQLEGKIAKWWTPDDVQFVDEIPLGATGKINKLKLREMFKDYTLPTA